MKIYPVLISLLFACQFLTPLTTGAFPQKALAAINSGRLNEGTNTVDIDGKSYTVTIFKGKPLYVQRHIFHPAMHGVYDSGILRYVEEAYAHYCLGDKDIRFAEIRFDSGSWKDFEAIDENTPFAFVNDNSRQATMTWEGDRGNIVMRFPVNYDIIKGGTRTEIEDRFIDCLRDYKASGMRERPKFSPDDLVEINSNLLQLKGKTYITEGVNRNIYLMPDKNGKPGYIFSSDFPLATMANLMIIGSQNVKPNVNLKVLKHEYGATETLTVPLESLLQYAAVDGCEAYWGIHSYDNNILKGVLFLYNETEGYDHVIRIECDTRKMMKEGFTMDGSASLYVPTNSVADLFYIEKPKSENEKIKY